MGGGGPKIRNPISDISNTVNRNLSAAGNTINKNLSNVGNNINRELDTPAGRAAVAAAALYATGGLSGLAGLGGSATAAGLAKTAVGGLMLKNLLEGGGGGGGAMPSAPELNAARQMDLLKQEAENRGRASEFGQQLQAISQGKKIDPAAALQQQMNLSQQVAAAKAARGGSSALASRNISQAAAQQSALQGASSLANAQQQFGQFLQGQQGLAQQGIQGMDEVAAKNYASQLGLAGAREEAGARRSAAQLEGIATMGAALLPAISDKNAKKDIKSAKNTPMDPEHFLSKLSSHSYKYKDTKDGKGTFLSPMAQELEKAGPVGKSMVEDTPEGKVVNYGRGFGAILAAQADLNRRLQKVEGKKG